MRTSGIYEDQVGVLHEDDTFSVRRRRSDFPARGKRELSMRRKSTRKGQDKNKSETISSGTVGFFIGGKDDLKAFWHSCELQEQMQRRCAPNFAERLEVRPKRHVPPRLGGSRKQGVTGLLQLRVGQ